MAEKIFDRERDLHQAVNDGTKELREIKERTTIESQLARQIERVRLQKKISR